MQIRQAPEQVTTMAEKFATALANATSTTVIADYNDPKTPIGTFGRWSLFERPDGTRASSSTDFLKPILSKIIKNCVVDKVLFDDDNKVVGVNAIRNGISRKLKVKYEVIISTGIHSNEILQRSGIGPSPYLISLGIKTVFDNPAVGKGSKNHLINIAEFSVNPADEPGTGTDINALYTGGQHDVDIVQSFLD